MADRVDPFDGFQARVTVTRADTDLPWCWLVSIDAVKIGFIIAQRSPHGGDSTGKPHYLTVEYGAPMLDTGSQVTRHAAMGRLLQLHYARVLEES